MEPEEASNKRPEPPLRDAIDIEAAGAEPPSKRHAGAATPHATKPSRGRPAILHEGFTYIGPSVFHHRRPTHRCNQCSVVVESRNIKNHKCRVARTLPSKPSDVQQQSQQQSIVSETAVEEVSTVPTTTIVATIVPTENNEAGTHLDIVDSEEEEEEEEEREEERDGNKSQGTTVIMSRHENGLMRFCAGVLRDLMGAGLVVDPRVLYERHYSRFLMTERKQLAYQAADCGFAVHRDRPAEFLLVRLTIYDALEKYLVKTSTANVVEKLDHYGFDVYNIDARHHVSTLVTRLIFDIERLLASSPHKEAYDV